MSGEVYISDIVGTDIEENFLGFDFTEIQAVLSNLHTQEAIDLPHAENLAQQSLRCADILAEYMSRLTKTVSYYEAKLNSLRNKASLQYTAPVGKTTAEMKKWAGEASPEVEELQIKLAKAKGSKVLVEKKYDIVIKTHHHFKDIATGLRKTILGYREGM